MIRAGSVGKKRHGSLSIGPKMVMNKSFGDNEWDEKGRTMVSHIYLAYDAEIIRSIQFGYLENGALVLSAKYGPSVSEGFSFRVVRLNQDEYVTGLSGVLVALSDREAIRNLTFHTNRGKHGPIGRSIDVNRSGSEVEIDLAIRERREFGGFFGSYNQYNLSSIGIYVNPIEMSDTVVNLKKVDQATSCSNVQQ